MGIATVGDLHRFDEAQLVARFGKWGTRLWELARGIDESPVEPSRKRKSWSSENTFERDITREEVEAWLRDQAARLWETLEKRSMRGRTVTVKLRTPDFTTATRRLTPAELPASADDLVRIATTLLDRFDFPAGARFRLAGVGVSNFLDEEEELEQSEPTLFA
jgi:DNA polymerase-4